MEVKYIYREQNRKVDQLVNSIIVLEQSRQRWLEDPLEVIQRLLGDEEIGMVWCHYESLTRPMVYLV